MRVEKPTKDSPDNTYTPGAVSPLTETDGNVRTSGGGPGDPQPGVPKPPPEKPSS
jgi:hypothetical protein